MNNSYITKLSYDDNINKVREFLADAEAAILMNRFSNSVLCSFYSMFSMSIATLNNVCDSDVVAVGAEDIIHNLLLNGFVQNGLLKIEVLGYFEVALKNKHKALYTNYSFSEVDAKDALDKAWVFINAMGNLIPNTPKKEDSVAVNAYKKMIGCGSLPNSGLKSISNILREC